MPRFSASLLGLLLRSANSSISTYGGLGIFCWLALPVQLHTFVIQQLSSVLSVVEQSEISFFLEHHALKEYLILPEP